MNTLLGQARSEKMTTQPDNPSKMPRSLFFRCAANAYCHELFGPPSTLPKQTFLNDHYGDIQHFYYYNYYESQTLVQVAGGLFNYGVKT